MKKTLLFCVSLLTLFAAPAMACEGFKTSMNALEQAVHEKDTAQTAADKHIQSLNQSLDLLEKAVQQAPAQQAQTPQPAQINAPKTL